MEYKNREDEGSPRIYTDSEETLDGYPKWTLLGVLAVAMSGLISERGN